MLTTLALLLAGGSDITSELVCKCGKKKCRDIVQRRCNRVYTCDGNEHPGSKGDYNQYAHTCILLYPGSLAIFISQRNISVSFLVASSIQRLLRRIQMIITIRLQSKFASHARTYTTLKWTSLNFTSEIEPHSREEKSIGMQAFVHV